MTQLLVHKPLATESNTGFLISKKGSPITSSLRGEWKCLWPALGPPTSSFIISHSLEAETEAGGVASDVSVRLSGFVIQKYSCHLRKKMVSVKITRSIYYFGGKKEEVHRGGKTELKNANFIIKGS